jgi:C4-dicarboxylate transporter
LFYWEHEFDATLKQLLVEAGFSAAAAADVCTSEWGMQDVGRASYDACLIAEEVLSSVNVAVVEEY